METQKIKGSKRYKDSLSKVDRDKLYEIQEASQLLNNFPKAKFDETVEIYAYLNIDPRKSDQMVRGTLQLPHGSGKSVRVIVFTENPEEALQNGAKEAGLDDLIEKVLGGWLDFDVAIATTSAMKSVRKVARVLGPRGLMPNPKSGTVSDDILSALKVVLGGRVEFKMDKTANLAIIVGKRSFKEDSLKENIESAINALIAAKPKNVTGKFIKSLTISSTMSPGIPLKVDEFNR